MQPSGTRHHAPVLLFSVRAGGQGWIKGQRWHGKAVRLFIPKGRARTKEACMVAPQAARLFIPRDWEGPWKGNSASLHCPSTTLPNPSGAGTFCSCPALGGALLSSPARRPHFVPRGTPCPPPAVPRGTFTNVNHCICNHYKCKLQM